jgi:hypothetical protein
LFLDVNDADNDQKSRIKKTAKEVVVPAPDSCIAMLLLLVVVEQQPQRTCSIRRLSGS